MSKEQFGDYVFKQFSFDGLCDDDIVVKEKQVVREEDRDIENETSKIVLWLLWDRAFNDCWMSDELYPFLLEHASL